MTVVSMEGNWARVRCEGTAVTDGYARPIKTARFSMDCRLPIITREEDWEKFGL